MADEPRDERAEIAATLALLMTEHRNEITEEDAEQLFAWIERMEKALRDILAWERAYPVERFPEPSSDQMRQAELVLRGCGVSLAAISADAMRHVLAGVANIARDGLGEP